LLAPRNLLMTSLACHEQVPRCQKQGSSGYPGSRRHSLGAHFVPVGDNVPLTKLLGFLAFATKVAIRTSDVVRCPRSLAVGGPNLWGRHSCLPSVAGRQECLPHVPQC